MADEDILPLLGLNMGGDESDDTDDTSGNQCSILLALTINRAVGC